MIDPETRLEIGDPDKLPFEDGLSPDSIKKLQENVDKRTKYGTATPSGIRQIFDTTHGDESTDYVDGTSTDITDAARIHVATIADCFADLIKTQTGKSKPTIVVAIDSRHTGPAIADVAIRTLLSHGINIKNRLTPGDLLPFFDINLFNSSAGFRLDIDLNDRADFPGLGNHILQINKSNLMNLYLS